VGYDGTRSQLWSADADGQGSRLQTLANYWIERTPIFSPDGLRLAYYHQTNMADGNFPEILVVDCRQGSDQPAQIVYKEYGGIDPDSLHWKNSRTLEVQIGGRWKEIDANGSIGDQYF